jgi:serine/threonine-protein kinase
MASPTSSPNPAADEGLPQQANESDPSQPAEAAADNRQGSPSPRAETLPPDQSQAASQLQGGSVLSDGSRLDDGPGASAAGNSIAALSMLGRTAAGGLSTVGASGHLGRPRPTSSPQSGPPPWLGKRVGRFRLMGLIGRGAMGKVFRAEDVQLHRQVALKVISSRSSRKRTAAQKWELFLREARSAAKLEHPNIVSVYEVASAADIHFIAMELVEGGNLKDLVTAAGPLDVPRACQLAAEAAEGLQHAHENNVVHRDVKPANLMLTRTGRCKLGDFGLARIDDGTDSGDGGLGSRVGTPQYVAPEVIEGEEATALSDVYSLGATLFFLLTGVPPFSGTDSREVMRKHVEELPPDIRTLRPDVPESLSLAIWRSMSKQPTARFESAGHFARALRVHTVHAEATDVLPDRFSSGAHARAHSAVAAGGVDQRRMALVAVLGGGLLVAVIVGAVGLAGRAKAPVRGTNMAPVTLPTMKQPGSDPSTRPSANHLSSEPHDTDSGTPAPVPLPAEGDILSVTDTVRLLRVANEQDPTMHSGWVTVTGWVQRALPRRDGPGWSIEFRGVDRRRGLICHTDLDLLSIGSGAVSMTDLRNRRIELRGEVELADGRPMIVCRGDSGLLLLDGANSRPYKFVPAPASQPATKAASTTEAFLPTKPATTQAATTPAATVQPATTIAVPTTAPQSTQPANNPRPVAQPAADVSLNASHFPDNVATRPSIGTLPAR